MEAPGTNENKNLKPDPHEERGEAATNGIVSTRERKRRRVKPHLRGGPT